MTDSFPWLTLPGSEGEPQRLELRADDTRLGRQPPAEVVLPYAAISRLHACLLRRAEGCFLVDLDSRNGTFLNGAPVGATPLRLADGDRIVLGGVIELIFHDPFETQVGERVGRLRGLWLDPVTQAVFVDGCRLDPPLSPPQLRLVQRLYHQEGQVISRAELMEVVWPGVAPAGISEEAVDGLIKRLRQRLRQASPNHELLEVVRGHGLRLLPPSDG